MSLAALAGQPDIPVSCGRTTPLQGDHAFPPDWRTRVDALAGLTLQAILLLLRLICCRFAHSQIISMPDKVTIITLGPLTNLAEALQSAPDQGKHRDGLYGGRRGGCTAAMWGFPSGIDNSVADWNIYVDPRAAAIVLPVRTCRLPRPAGRDQSRSRYYEFYERSRKIVKR